jgi:beta-glucosidase
MDGVPLSIMNMLSKKKGKPAEELVANVDYTKYEEGIYVGYRHFDKNNLEVSYPFGYGLSYTDFTYNNMDIELVDGNIDISVQLENTGMVPGKEVVEIYVSKPDSEIDRAIKELKAFAKTPLIQSGESTELTMRIPVSDLSYWNEKISGWTLEKGAYTIHVGSSSRDIHQSVEISL